MQTGSKKLEKGSLLDKWLSRKKKQGRGRNIEPRPDGVDSPLSLGQRRLLFLQQLYPDNPFYNVSEAYRFKGILNLDHLIKSFELVAKRHEILRTNIQIKNDKPVQVVKEKPLINISKHDLRDLPEKNRIERAEIIAFEEAREVFDLKEGYLTNVSILQVADDDVLVILTMHHIIFDRWSMRVFLKESAEYYQKLCTGEQIEISPLKIQFADYAYWQSKQKTDATNLAYWKEKLENSLELLDLPTDFSRPSRPTFKGAYSTYEFSEELSKKLKSFAKESDTTLFVLLLTAYKILLHKYSGEKDILIGSPVTGRDKVELEKLIGFFNDTLVLRSDLSDNSTFTELLAQVKQTFQDALTHKNMPFETLVKTLKPERFLNYNPLFQAMFIYQNVPTLPTFDENLSVEHKPFDFGVTKFDLTLYISDEKEQIRPIIEYSKDLFNKDTIKRMHFHYENLIEGILENPNQRISDLPIITDNELSLFNEWNDTDSEVKDETIIDLFIKQAKAKPEHTAVTFQNEKLTYKQLDEHSNSVANYLLKLDLDRKNPIGLFVESSLELIVGILGIMKAGFSYLPIDSDYPKDRIKYILENSGASTILTQTKLLYFISDESVTKETIENIVENESIEKPKVENKIVEEDLAYVIYTSGSMGNPKGVSITHKNLVSSTSARFDFYPEYPKSFLLLSSFSFDSSMVGIFWTLSTGGKLVLAERRIEQDLERLADIFESEKISHTLLLPTLYSALLKSIANEKFEALEIVIVAGEACPTSLCKEHFETLPDTKLYNEYGPTEATVWATAHEIKADELSESVPIGKPISNTQIYILDESKRRVPIGIWGEMYIGGKGVAKGYFNNSELTEKRFVKNPFNENERLYRTGDLCRYKSNGVIEFGGRKDNQIKIRGYRIELGEIQEVVKEVLNVQDAIIKIEGSQKVSNEQNKEQSLLNSLEQIKAEDADEIMKSIENLSDKEIEFMLNETERV